MKKVISAAIAAIAVACAIPSQAASVDIKGDWVIELAPMVAQASSMKATPEEIAQLERTFKDGLMVVDASIIKLSLPSSPGKPIAYKYKLDKLKPTKDNCVTLVMEALPKPLAYCIEDGLLSVNDPTSALVSVYRRK
jgi:hypothetical protein